MFFCDQKNQKSRGPRDAPGTLNAFKGPAGPLKIPVTDTGTGLILFLRGAVCRAVFYYISIRHRRERRLGAPQAKPQKSAPAGRFCF